MAEILPFPLHRRANLIRRQAAWFIEQPARAAEKNLQYLLRRQVDTLLSKGVQPDIARVEAEALAGAIRAEVWRMTFASGGAA